MPYPVVFRRNIVRLVRDGSQPAVVAREFGVPRPTIYRWLMTADEEDGSTPTSAEARKIKRLEKENERLRLELEIKSRAVEWYEEWEKASNPKGSTR